MLTPAEVRHKYPQLSFQQFAQINSDTLIGTKTRETPDTMHVVAVPVAVPVTLTDAPTDALPPDADAASTPARYPFEFRHVPFARSPAQYKCFDEVWVNAIDQFIRLAFATMREAPEREAIAADAQLALELLESPEAADDPDTMQTILSALHDRADRYLARATTPCNRLEVDITPTYMRVFNNGDGMDVVEHPDAPGIYVPQFMLTNDRTSTNYFGHEDECRGGKNGVGMPSVISNATAVTVRTFDRFSGLAYAQTYRDHMTVIEPPTIRPLAPNDSLGTEVLVTLDFPLFECTENEPTFVDYARRRVIETLFYLANASYAPHFVGTKTHAALHVFFNGVAVPVPTSTTLWPQLYSWIRFPSIAPSAALTPSWTLQLALMPGVAKKPLHMSLVNGVRTENGGTHVQYVLRQLLRVLGPLVHEQVLKYCQTEKIIILDDANAKLAGKRGAIKKYPELREAHLSARLALFLVCDVMRPTYEGQCKDRLGQKIAPDTVRHWAKKPTARNPDAFADHMFPELPEALLKWLKSQVLATLVYDVVSPTHLKLFDCKPKIAGARGGDADEDDDERARSVDLAATKPKTTKRVSQLLIPALQDAVMAGTAQSLKCTLAFTEGNSASGIVGSAQTNNQYFGTFTARGKISNVSSMNFRMQMAAKKGTEYELVLSLGLTEYRAGVHTREDVAKMLRYGVFLILCDQDFDGTHITCQSVALMFHFFASLMLWFPEFVQIMNTPLIELVDRAIRTRALATRYFFTDAAANAFVAANAHRTFERTYLKGLGSSDVVAFRQYFKLSQPTVVRCTGTESERKLILQSFDASEQEYRAADLCGDAHAAGLVWNADGHLTTARLQDHDAPLLDLSTRAEITIEELFRTNLRVYRRYALMRCAPGEDGLKHAERKLLWGVWMHYGTHGRSKPLMKTAQLGSECANRTGYHHGEVSMINCLTRLAALHYGESNNLHLFEAAGNFGAFEKDFEPAAPRYTHVRPAKVFAFVFREEDVPVLEREMEDGELAEPRMFAPIVPLTLLIGQNGVTAGATHRNMVFRVEDVLAYLRVLLDWIDADEAVRTVAAVKTLRDESSPLTATFPRWTAPPTLYGFEGCLEMRKARSEAKAQYHVLQRGRYEVLSPTKIQITAIPPTIKYQARFREMFAKYDREEKGVGTSKTKAVLGTIAERSFQLERGRIRTVLTFQTPEALAALRAERVLMDGFELDGIEKHLLVSDSFDVMYTYVNAQGHIQKFASIEELVWQYAQLRWWFYRRRRVHWVKVLTQRALRKEAQARFVELLREDATSRAWRDLQSLAERRAWLTTRGFVSDPERARDAGAAADFDYLLDLRIDSVSADRARRLREEAVALRADQERCATRRIVDWWREELVEFEAAWRDDVERETDGDDAAEADAANDADATRAKQPRKRAVSEKAETKQKAKKTKHGTGVAVGGADCVGGHLGGDC